MRVTSVRAINPMVVSLVNGKFRGMAGEVIERHVEGSCAAMIVKIWPTGELVVASQVDVVVQTSTICAMCGISWLGAENEAASAAWCCRCDRCGAPIKENGRPGEWRHGWCKPCSLAMEVLSRRGPAPARSAPKAPPAPPIPIRITCPACGTLHVDEGDFATRPHHTHACQGCGLTWRPAIVPTVGVQYLPGFKNDP